MDGELTRSNKKGPTESTKRKNVRLRLKLVRKGIKIGQNRVGIIKRREVKPLDMFRSHWTFKYKYKTRSIRGSQDCDLSYKKLNIFRLILKLSTDLTGLLFLLEYKYFILGLNFQY